jgi:hypothetical protein
MMPTSSAPSTPAAPSAAPADAVRSDEPPAPAPVDAVPPTPSAPAPALVDAVPSGASPAGPGRAPELTAAGLVRRSPKQQIRELTADASTATGVRPVTGQRSPEEVRRMLSRYRTGLQRGRLSVAQGAGDPGAGDGAGGPVGATADSGQRENSGQGDISGQGHAEDRR